jgi:hypothetical protein
MAEMDTESGTEGIMVADPGRQIARTLQLLRRQREPTESEEHKRTNAMARLPMDKRPQPETELQLGAISEVAKIPPIAGAEDMSWLCCHEKDVFLKSRMTGNSHVRFCEGNL